MKNYILKIFLCSTVFIGISSCSKYLDFEPDSIAFSEDEVFSSYERSQQFIDQLLAPFVYFDDNDLFNNGGTDNLRYLTVGKKMYGSRERITDNCLPPFKSNWMALNNYREGIFEINPSGNYFYEAGSNRFVNFWKAIRVCNLSITNINKIKGLTALQKDNILGMAYFMKAHFYFMLLQGWGGMPWLNKPLDPAQDMDLPRDSYTLTAQKIAATLDTAATYLPLRVEPSSWGRPSKMGAIAYKAKALVWAASPFSNPSGEKKLWQDAAVACAEAIKMAESSNYYSLVTMDKWRNLFTDVTNEEAIREVLFGRYIVYNSTRNSYICGIMSSPFSGSNGAESPTESLAQCFPWSNGEPIDENSDEYKHHPYDGDGLNHTGRDPRFYQTINFNGSVNPFVAAVGRKMEMWNSSTYADKKGASDLLMGANGVAVDGYTKTGYYNWKLHSAGFTGTGGAKANIMWNYIRLADIYLYYAESANRAWGPSASPQGVNGFTMTAIGALNKIRERAQMPLIDGSKPWLIAGTTDNFEKLVRNEIRIETAFEEKRFYDLRRWRLMTDPSVLKLKGMYITRTGANDFDYRVITLPDQPMYRLNWQEKHYLFPIPTKNTELGTNFKQNPGW